MSINIYDTSIPHTPSNEFTILVPVVPDQVKPFYNTLIADHAPLPFSVSNAFTDLTIAGNCCFCNSPPKYGGCGFVVS